MTAAPFDLRRADSPLGPFAVLFRAEPFCIFRILLPGESVPKARPLDDRTDSPPALREVVRMIQAYFEGKPIGAPPWKWLHTADLTGLERAVLEATARIPYGGLRAYRDIALAAGRPKACRAVGNALGKNPFPILIPCHRVIRASGEIGGFGGGTALKKKLIALEARFVGSTDSGVTGS